MTEPTTSVVAGSGLAATLIALVGPEGGEYATILWAGFVGALWPLRAIALESKWDGLWFMLKIVGTASVLAGSTAYWVEKKWGIPATQGLAPIAFCIGLAGNRWPEIGEQLVNWVKARITGVNIQGAKDDSNAPPTSGK